MENDHVTPQERLQHASETGSAVLRSILIAAAVVALCWMFTP
jgi:hypothetical protein